MLFFYVVSNVTIFTCETELLICNLLYTDFSIICIYNMRKFTFYVFYSFRYKLKHFFVTFTSVLLKLKTSVSLS